MPRSLLAQVSLATDVNDTVFIKPTLVQLETGAFRKPKQTSLPSKDAPRIYIAANHSILKFAFENFAKQSKGRRMQLRGLVGRYNLDESTVLSKLPVVKHLMLLRSLSQKKRAEPSPEAAAILRAAIHPEIVRYIERALLMDVHRWMSRCSAVANVQDMISAANLHAAEDLTKRRSEKLGLNFETIVDDSDMDNVKAVLPSSFSKDFSTTEQTQICAIIALQRFHLFHEQGISQECSQECSKVSME